jgi:hypothetical protein
MVDSGISVAIEDVVVDGRVDVGGCNVDRTAGGAVAAAPCPIRATVGMKV